LDSFNESFIVAQDLKHLDSFSINGKYLTSLEDTKEILNPLIVTDSHFAERLVYGNVTGKLIIVKLPYFDQQEVKPCLEKSSVYPLMVTPDKRLLIYYNLGL
jgi:hypothetical protein